MFRSFLTYTEFKIHFRKKFFRRHLFFSKIYYCLTEHQCSMAQIWGDASLRSRNRQEAFEQGRHMMATENTTYCFLIVNVGKGASVIFSLHSCSKNLDWFIKWLNLSFHPKILFYQNIWPGWHHSAGHSAKSLNRVWETSKILYWKISMSNFMYERFNAAVVSCLL